MIIISGNIFNVNQRVAGHWEGETFWRVSLTIDEPLAINQPELIGLAKQLDLTQADVQSVLGTDAFPPQLKEPGVPSRQPRHVQWAYKPAVAALIALGEAKLKGLAE